MYAVRVVTLRTMNSSLDARRRPVQGATNITRQGR